jgi:hypothetical protein
MTDEERLAFLGSMDSPQDASITDDDRDAYLNSLELEPMDEAQAQPQPVAQPAKQPKPGFMAESISAPRPGLSVSEYFPNTSREIQRLKNNVLTALGPGGSLSQTALSIPADIINASLIKPAMTGIAQLRRASSGRPMMPPAQAYATEMRGGELPANKEEATMRLLTEGAIGMLPMALANKAPFQGVSQVEPISGKPGYKLNLGRMRNPFKGLNDQEIEALAQRVRQAFFGAKKATGIEFESDLATAVTNNPGKVVPEARPLIESIRTRLSADPEFAQRIYNGLKRSIDPKKPEEHALVRFFKDPALADSATAQDVQQIKMALESIPQLSRAKQRIPNQRYQAGGQANASVANVDLDIQDYVDEFRLALLSKYPELVPAYAKYSDFMNDFRMIRRGMTEAQLEGKLQHGFKTAEQREAARRILPKEIQHVIKQSQKIERGAVRNKKLALGSPLAIGVIDYARRLFKK